MSFRTGCFASFGVPSCACKTCRSACSSKATPTAVALPLPWRHPLDCWHISTPAHIANSLQENRCLQAKQEQWEQNTLPPRRRPFHLDIVRAFGRQLLEAVAYLHDLGLIHTDLKPENILLQSATYEKKTPPAGSRRAANLD